MDVNTPGQPPQPPQAYEPPTQPPPPYAPPAAAPPPYSPPPAQLPYAPPPQAQPPYAPPPQAQPPYAPAPPAQPPYAPQQPVGYPPAGGYAPPPPPMEGKRKGFNWLACCGISCLVLLIIGGGIGFCTYRLAKPFVQMASDMEAVNQKVMTASEADVISQAAAVDPATLLADPAAYKGAWISVEGLVGSTNPIGSSFSSGSFNSSNTTPYTLQEGLIILDTSRAPAVGVTGDTIRGYGQVYSFDMEEMKKMPLIGPMVYEEIKKDPSMQGQLKIVFVLAKKVELVSAGSGAPGAPAGADGTASGAPGNASNWIK